MLWGNEGSLSTEYWEARLQFEGFEIEERVKPFKLWRSQEKITYFEHQAKKLAWIIWQRRSIV